MHTKFDHFPDTRLCYIGTASYGKHTEQHGRTARDDAGAGQTSHWVLTGGDTHALHAYHVTGKCALSTALWVRQVSASKILAVVAACDSRAGGTIPRSLQQIQVRRVGVSVSRLRCCWIVHLRMLYDHAADSEICLWATSFPPSLPFWLRARKVAYFGCCKMVTLWCSVNARLSLQ